MSAPATTRPRLRGVTWVVVRQHRRILTTMVVLLAVATLVTGGLRVAYEATAYSADTGLFTRFAFHGGLSAVADFFARAAPLLPLLVAAVVAGPVIARELESGTYKLVWSQSVPPARWFAAKTAVPAAAVALAGAGVVVLFRVLWGPTASDYRLSWHERQVFLALGPTLVAHCLLAVAVGALVGLLVRRTMAAMSSAGLVTGAVMLVMTWLSGSLWPPVTVEQRGLRHEGWWDRYVTDEGLLTSAGERLPPTTCSGPAYEYETCLARHDVVGRYWDYHPDSHLWPLQLVESGVVLALAGAVACAAFRIFRRRHA
ncbi:ABC transporter permease [Streptomyces sp. NPDC006274]|uniref:ABC transporter permease n=1 Tax=unclassified Streptomyces TaxID=2593676 RepID=UPI0033BD1D06